MPTRRALPVLAALSMLVALPASAQNKPMHSGHMSHNAPQMRRHGGGLHRPNRPHYHHHRGYHGYRPAHHHEM